ncbi:GvpL/GvpF family gas vesicle protein [Candidatus Saganbacteria bacterium]|nr:GvpL/GvpF family gas vesicle protein [Candidatus Saganbacteria bacterium]
MLEKYIYGIINSNEEKSINIENENAYVISCDGISAVVSDAEKVDYRNLPRETLARCLVKHQQVIEKVMRNFTIIPMRMGTYATDEEEVRRILAKGYPLIKDILNRAADTVEIDVVATRNNFEQILKEVGNEPEIKEFKEKIITEAKGITLEDQLKIGALVKKALDAKKESIASEIQTALKPVSLDVKTHAAMNDQMVMNAAFLINIVNREEFDQKIEELNAKYADKLNFRCVGPLPSYSFYTLEVLELKFDEIEWAKKKLRLRSGQIGEDEVKRAYKKFAKLSHPDVKEGGDAEFEEITKAYKLLKNYSRAGNDALLVKVRES